jgi:tetratricopeptide (TPR) repeat protein
LGWPSSGKRPFYPEMRRGESDELQGGEKYQQAFYVFEELAQAPATTSSQGLVSQAVAEIHLGRLEEAEAALQQVLAKDPNNTDSLANTLVLNVIAGKDVSELIRYVSQLSMYNARPNWYQHLFKNGPRAPLPPRPPRKERIV